MKKYLKITGVLITMIIIGVIGFVVIRDDVCYYDGHIWSDKGICSPSVVDDSNTDLPKNTVFDNKLKLVEFEGKCGSSREPAGETKILNHHFISNDTMEVKVQTEVTCCVDFKGTIKSGKNIIDLQFVETGEPCYCLCKGILNYKIKGVDKRRYQFYLNGKLIK